MVAIALVGAVGNATRVTAGTTITSTYGQTPTARNLLVAVVSRVGSTATASPTSTVSAGWTRLLPTNFVTNIGVGSATACTNLVDIWYKVATGTESNGDTTFTMTNAGGTTTFAMTCTIYELSGARGLNPLDVSGTQSSGASTATITTTTTTTSANVSSAGHFAISVACRERTAGTTTVTYSASWTNGANDGATSSVAHTGTAYLANVTSGATASDVTTWSGTGTLAFGAGAIVVVAAAQSGPTLNSAWSHPVGNISVPVRVGLGMATFIPSATVAPPPTPTVGPPFYPFRWAVRAKITLFQSQSGGVFAELPVGTGNISGPVSGGRPGGGMGCGGAPVRNPTPGPVFIQRKTPVRFIIPNWQPRAGRIGSSFGAPVINPHRGPPVYPLEGPVRGRLPQLAPRAGRIGSNPGAPVRNPSRGPVFYPQKYPIAAADPLPRKGRVASNPGTSVTVTPPAVGPRIYPLEGPVRSRIPQTFSKGRIGSNSGAPVQNPSTGPQFRQVTDPVRSEIPQTFSKGRISSNPGAPVRNPSTGPQFRQLPRPVRAPIPQTFSKGRVNSSQGTIKTTGPVFYPAVQALHAKLPLQPLLRGRTYSNDGAPVQNPSTGPVFRQKTFPVQATDSLPRRGRTYSNPGGPVQNPPPVVVGPVFYPKNYPARIRPSLPIRGRTYGNAGAPVRNPSAGPVFRQKTFPVQSADPLPRKGRVYSNPGGPVQNPPPVVIGPVFYPRHDPARIRITQPPRGRVAGN